jgi:hypothetical protein
MWGMLASLIGGPILNSLVAAYKARLEATNTTERLAVDLAAKEIAAEIEARKAAQAIIIAEQGRWWTAAIRPMFAAPFVIFTWKVVVWDKVLGWGTTDPLAGEIATWAGYVILAYFGGRSLEKVAQIFKR